MQIQSWEEKISQCAGDVRASTGADGESQRVDRSTKLLRKDGLAKVEEEICSVEGSEPSSWKQSGKVAALRWVARKPK